MADQDRRRRATWGLAAAGGLALGAAAAGQENSWFWEVEYSDPAGVINSPDDTAMVTLWAAWDPSYYALRGAILDVTASDPRSAGEWMGWETLDPFFGVGFSDHGTLDGDSIRGIHALQIYWPWWPPIYADTSNPIMVWRGWWQTSDLTPRDVTVHTLTDHFWIYSEWDFADFVDVLTEGEVVISVVPAPSVAGAALAILLVQRRRR